MEQHKTCTNCFETKPIEAFRLSRKLCRVCELARLSVKEFHPEPIACKKCNVIKPPIEYRYLRRTCRDCEGKGWKGDRILPADRPKQRTCAECGMVKPREQFRRKPVCLDCIRLIKENTYQSRRSKAGSEAYRRFLEQQGGVCAICKLPETRRLPNGLVSDFALDHNHKTLKNRGVLCYRCNAALGLFKDSQTNLEAAVEYLKRDA